MKSILSQLTQFPDELYGFSSQRKAIITNRIILLIIALGTIHYLIDILTDSVVSGGHLAFFFFLFSCSLILVINWLGHFKASKAIGFFLLNVILYNLCASQNMRTGVQLNLITCSLVALVAFGFKELKWGITFTIISIISFIVSSLYKTSLLEYKELTEHQMIVQFTLNLILFITVSFYSIFILLRQNFKIEKKLHEKNTSLNELNMAKDRLFSIIGHDLKAPLNSLSAFASLLAVNAVSEAEIKMLSKSLTHSINNTRNLLEDLLEWAQSQTGLIGFEPERFDLSLVVKENIQLIAPSATEKKITLTNDIQGEVFVNAHRNSINMVVRNLLSNAIKFTKEGGAVTIFITVSNQVIVSVQDTGIGIAQETARRLFQLGKTVSTLGTANEKGTGLGLILCREFIEKNGGSIGVESKEGEGSRFYFTLPTR